jgi:hypothetical protein
MKIAGGVSLAARCFNLDSPEIRCTCPDCSLCACRDMQLHLAGDQVLTSSKLFILHINDRYRYPSQTRHVVLDISLPPAHDLPLIEHRRQMNPDACTRQHSTLIRIPIRPHSVSRSLRSSPPRPKLRSNSGQDLFECPSRHVFLLRTVPHANQRAFSGFR